jgi:cytochrome P450
MIAESQMRAIPTDVTDDVAAVFAGGPDMLADPYPLYERVRTAGPVHWLPANSDGPWTNAWHVVGYDEVAAALKDRRLGAHRLPAPPAAGTQMTAAQHAMAELGRISGLTLLYLDPPDHTRLRLVTAQTLIRRISAEALRPRIVQIVGDLLNRVDERESFDIVADLAMPLPTLVVAEILGIPKDEQAAFVERTGGLMTLHPTQQAITNALHNVALLREHLHRRRLEPGDDLVTDLLRAQTNDDSLTDDELIAQCHTVVVAGTETLTAAIATSVATLLRHREVWNTLSEKMIGAVVAELLRFDGPTHLLPREAREPLDLAGHTIQTGQRLWLWVAAANHDPSRFPQPDRLVVGRNGSRHLAFGGGIHSCIGAALARLELKVLLLGLRARHPALRMTNPEVEWMPNSAMRSPARLDVR